MANLPYSKFAVANSAISTLSVGISSSDTILTLALGDGTKFPASNFILRINDELILVASRVADACSSLTRAFDSTSAAAHSSGAAVVSPLCAQSYNRIYDNLTDHTHTEYESLWTTVVLVSNFTTSSATAVNVTGLSFTPAANTRYIIEGRFMLRTATTTVGPRPGVAWPTGMTDGVVTLRVTSAAGTQVLQNGNINAAVLAPVGGLPNTTQSWPGSLEGMLLAGASPGSTFRIQLASETAGTNVTMQAGSYFRYRTY